MAESKNSKSELTPQQIAKAEEERLTKEREGKSAFYFPDAKLHGVTIWAEDLEAAQAELEKRNANASGDKEDSK